MKPHPHLLALGIFALGFILMVGQAHELHAQGPAPQAVLGTGFTYQGQLNKGGAPVTATCSFTFSLWDAATGNGQVGASQTMSAVAVDKGLFTVVLNSGAQFGANAFTGQARWLQTTVKCAGDSSPVTLSRQQLTAAPSALFASAPWVTSGTSLSYSLGSVGIGTPSPSAALSVVTGGATQPIAFGLPTGVKIGTASGTIPLAIRQNANEASTPGLALFETASGDLGGLGAEQDKFIISAAVNKSLEFKVNGSTTAMSIFPTGGIAIGGDLVVGSASACCGRLVIQGAPNQPLLRANSPAGNLLFAVGSTGIVTIANLASPSSAVPVCYGLGGFLSACSSAAEYVPTVDNGLGYPEAADLVSINPAKPNPYGDEHSPFVVSKSDKACDPNLLGYMLHPHFGAAGEKKNDHYLPLAIYGYFPAKVSLENGLIHRGDALTSSSKPGHAMKATDACKIIGYALEDANQDGAIQVFAQHGETAAAEVAALRTQVDDLKQQMNALTARLDALESRQAPVQSGRLPNGALLWGALALAGVVSVRRWRR